MWWVILIIATFIWIIIRVNRNGNKRDRLAERMNERDKSFVNFIPKSKLDLEIENSVNITNTAIPKEKLKPFAREMQKSTYVLLKNSLEQYFNTSDKIKQSKILAISLFAISHNAGILACDILLDELSQDQCIKAANAALNLELFAQSQNMKDDKFLYDYFTKAITDKVLFSQCACIIAYYYLGYYEKAKEIACVSRNATTSSNPYNSLAEINNSLSEINNINSASTTVTPKVTQNNYSKDTTSLFKLIEENASPDEIKRLLDSNVNVNVRNQYKWTPLHRAIYIGSDPLIIDLLLQYGADIKAKAVDGSTPIDFALQDNPILFDLFTKNNKKINVNSDKWKLALHDMIIKDFPCEAIESVLKLGVNINNQTDDGWTPLHVAIDQSKPKIMKLLLKYKADITLKNSDNLTPLDLAYEIGDSYAIDVLKSMEVTE